jgi:HK97 gp10 family phage protein
MGKAMDITGDKALAALLGQLPDRVARKVLKSAVNAAANPVLKSARRRVRKRTGLLKKSLGKKTVTNKKTDSATAIVGPRQDVQGVVNGKPYRPARIAHLVEKGFINEHGEHVPPQPFLFPAMQETESEAIGIMQTKLAEGVIREATKAAL